MAIGRMILGAVLGVALFFSGVLMEGGHLSSFIQATSFIMLAGVTAGFLLMTFPLAVHRDVFRVALGTGPIEKRRVAVANRYFGAMGQAISTGSFAGLAVGLIHVMENLNRPDQIGSGVAMAFLCLFYGLLGRVFVSGALADAAASRDRDILQPIGSEGVSTAEGAVANSASTITETEVVALRAKVGELVMRLEEKVRNAA